MIPTKFKTLESKAYVKNGFLRLLFVSAAIIAEIAYVMYIMGEFSASHPWVSAVISLLAVVVALIIYGRHENASMKMVWMLLIIAFRHVHVPADRSHRNNPRHAQAFHFGGQPPAALSSG